MAVSKQKNQRSRASSAARLLLVLTALLLPSLSLLPLGGLYLWEHGYLLYWAIGAAVAVLLVFAIQRFLLGDKSRIIETADAETDADHSSPPHPAWTSREKQAWADVKGIARQVDIASLTDAQAFFDLGHRTINVVARRIHGDRDDALWHFTMPEALAITERVSARLGTFIEHNIPFGDRLTVAQVLQVYRWRTLADVAEKAYDIWRIVRLSNPATALTNEARERMSKALMQWGRDHVSRRLAETYIEEVGRAAIDLYGGRLRLSQRDLRELAWKVDDPHHNASMTIDEPVEILIVSADPDRSQSLYALLQGMEAKRISAVTEFVHGGAVNETLLRAAPLHVSVFPFDELSSSDQTHPLPSAANVTIIAFIARSPNALDDLERNALRRIIDDSQPASPVVLPIVDQMTSSGRTAAPILALLSAHLTSHAVSHMAEPIALTFTEAHHTEDQQTVWRALFALSIHTRRIQLLRRLQGSMNRRDWAAGAKQAASAVGRLSKRLVRRSTHKN